MVDVTPAFVAGDEPAVAVDPGEGALDDLAVPAQLLAGLNAASGCAGSDPATAAGLTAAPVVIGPREAIPRRGRLRSRLEAGLELFRPAAWPPRLAADRRDAARQVLERHAVVGVGVGQDEGERDAAPVGDQVALGAQPASVGRVRLVSSPSLCR